MLRLVWMLRDRFLRGRRASVAPAPSAAELEAALERERDARLPALNAAVDAARRALRAVKADLGATMQQREDAHAALERALMKRTSYMISSSTRISRARRGGDPAAG